MSDLDYGVLVLSAAFAHIFYQWLGFRQVDDDDPPYYGEVDTGISVGDDIPGTSALSITRGPIRALTTLLP